MIGTEVFVEGYRLDVATGLDFSFNYSVSDVRDPDKRQTEFTKTIRCVGTSNNNILFGNLFEADISNPFDINTPNAGANFNPNKKASVQVFHNSLPQLDGSMQLRNIKVTQGKIEYEVVFIGRLIDLFGVWGDQQLNGRDEDGNPIIDLSDLDHDLTEGNQSATWYAPVGVGYVYPLIDYGRNTTLVDNSGVRTYPAIDLRPALYVQELWNRIFALADATYDGAFFTNGVFERLCLPWVVGFQLSSEDLLLRELQAIRTTDRIMYVPPDVVGGRLYDMEQVTLDVSNQYYLPTSQINVANNSTYQISGFMQFSAEQLVTNPSVAGSNDFDVYLYVNGVLVSTVLCYIGLSATTLLPIGTTTISGSAFTFPDVILDEFDVVEVRYGVPAGSTVQVDYEVYLLAGSSLSMTAVNTELAYGDLVRMNFGMPDVTIKEFFLGILKMFNLYLTPSKTIDRHYTFETRDQFYNSGVLLDWTYKLDRSKTVTTTPMGLLSGREYVYTYKEDGDYYNERYQKNYGKAYGNRTLNIDNDFVPEKKETSVVFSGTPLCNDGISSRIIPKIYDADITDGAKQTDANIRILYYGGMLPSSPSWAHQIVTGTSIVYDNYPYAGHWDNPITPTLDINWGISFEYYYQANGATGIMQVTNNNLFKAYHERQFLEIASKDSKLISAMFYLTELDIQQLDFRNTILIDQTYYRLNKVIDYNPFKTGLTKVELFKAGDITIEDAQAENINDAGQFGFGKMAEPAPKQASKRLLNGNQYEPFQGKVIGSDNTISPNATNFFVQGENNQVGASRNVTLIGSNNVVANGVENVVAIGVNNLNITQSNTVINGNGGIQTKTITIPSAQVLTGFATPIPFGLTVPVGYFVQPLTVQFGVDFNTVAYATNTGVAVRAVGASVYIAQHATALAATLSRIVNLPMNVSPTAGQTQYIDGADLEFYVQVGNPTAGDSNVDVYLTYMIIPL